MGRKSDYVAEVQADVRAVLSALDSLRNKQQEATALDYLNTLVEADLEGSSEGIAPADVIAVVFTTMDAIDGLLATGHSTNLFKLR